MCEISELVVMVVDSDEDSLTEMCDILTSLGLKRLLCAPDAESALYWLQPEKNGDIDIILSSNVLSGMDGFLFVNKARAMCPNKQIIMYSNCKKPTAYLAALNIGATDYIDKDENFRSNVHSKLPFWIDITQRQVKLEGGNSDKRN